MKTSIDITRYYRLAVMLPGLIIFLGYIIFEIGFLIFGEEYKSEWLTNDVFVFFGVVIILVQAFIMFILSIPLMLNTHFRIRANRTKSFLTWFLAPMIWLVFLLVNYYRSINSFETVGESVWIFSNTLPYTIGLIWTFIRFRKEVKGELADQKIPF
jgi:hypothetical protein